jgi:RND family efflux transporter MFP subunit
MLKSGLVLTTALLSLTLAACKEEPLRVSDVRPVRAETVTPSLAPDERAVVGDIRPRRESDHGFRVSGKIVTIPVHVGDTVKAGDILASLDDEDFSNRLKQAAADLKSADAVLEEARANEGRQRQLLATGVTTRAAYDAARKTLLASEATQQSARVALKMAGDQLSYAELRAEFDGIVTATNAEAGQVVGVGQMVVRLAPLGERDAVFAVAESTIQDGAFKLGDPVDVALLSDPSLAVDGVVREVSPIADPATRTFDVKVALAPAPHQMLFGASVSGHAIATTRPEISLPLSAVFEHSGTAAVWIYGRDKGAVSLRPVTIARFTEDHVVIAEGLARGDVVVTAGVNRLREGQKVKLVEENAL